MQWKLSPTYPDYEISENGDVRRADSGTRLKGKVRQGYMRFKLRKDGRGRCVTAHRLVVDAFIGPRPFSKAEICHNDGQKLNTHVSNLRWDTRRANMDDRIAHGQTSRGARNGTAKLDDAKVVEIRGLLAAGELQRIIAASFGVSRTTIGHIANGFKWAHVA